MSAATVAVLAGAVSIASLRRACGSAEVVAIDPGDEPEIGPGGIRVSRGRPVSGRCLACLLAGSAPKPQPALECYRCAGTSEDGLVFTRQRKPRGRPLLCTDCADEPAAAVPVFVRETYRRHAAARAGSPQMDIEDAVRGAM